MMLERERELIKFNVKNKKVHIFFKKLYNDLSIVSNDKNLNYERHKVILRLQKATVVRIEKPRFIVFHKISHLHYASRWSLWNWHQLRSKKFGKFGMDHKIYSMVIIFSRKNEVFFIHLFSFTVYPCIFRFWFC